MCKGERGQKKKKKHKNKNKNKEEEEEEREKKKCRRERKKKDESMQGRKREWMCNKIQFFCFSFFATMHSYRWLGTVAIS